ncbi:MAG: DNA (cytosine-5-)-methyltransferase, partial [Paramuribaculum sp.]|nr:DNA (cytosine-5-)-methyltransferase [Paramuribaculum sp.]
MLNNNWEEESVVIPRRTFTSIELFAGGGGLALGIHKAGFKHLLLNELDKDACTTLKKNMPDWNVIQTDIHDVDFTPYCGRVDLLTGGFPCQAFSYAGKRLGFEETRGTLFFE